MRCRSLKILLITLGISSALSLIFTGPIPHLLHYFNPHMWLSLSHWGLNSYFMWQIVTYILVPPPGTVASLSFLINTAFTLYLVHTVGSALIAQKGQKHFWILFAGGGAVGGALTALMLFLSGSMGVLAGWTPALYAILVGWMLLNPHAQVLVFFALPMRVKWVVVGAAAITLYLDLTEGHYLQFVASSSAVLFGYFYAILAWDIHSPFAALQRFERLLHKLKGKKTYEFEVDSQY